MEKLNNRDIEFIKRLMQLKESSIYDYYRILGMMEGLLIAQNYYNNQKTNLENEEV